jgi:cellulose synthase/poly-beta-1,6-N-acetylglucosamine synthase-like glycosyltransferase
MAPMDILVVILYNAVIWPLLVYNLGQLSLLVSYLWAVRTGKPDPATGVDDAPVAWPMVTVQLPVYNERYVAERLIDAVAQLDYPANKLQIQVLDDSTDDTTLLIARRVSHHQQRGQLLRLEHVRRTVRTGYKAGALAHGLTTATGTLIAVFDADFVPDPAFLHQTVPHFADPGVGLVQTRWTHLNRDYSLLTQLQGFGLDAHFFVEQRGRTAAGLLINFNGTGGIWRKTTILDAGGWSSHRRPRPELPRPVARLAVCVSGRYQLARRTAPDDGRAAVAAIPLDEGSCRVRAEAGPTPADGPERVAVG